MGSSLLTQNSGAVRGQLASNPAFFIVGVPGSGTSGLERLLNAHPQLAVAPDIHHITGFFETRAGLCPEGFMAPQLVAKWLEQRRFDSFQIDHEDIRRIIPAGELLDYKLFISRLLDLYSNVKGKPLVGSRTLDYLRLLPAIRALWPGTRFIHVIRDGRDVCAGALKWGSNNAIARRFSTWSEDPVSTIALWWKWLVKHGREAGAALGPELYLELRFDSLRLDQTGVWSRILRFLGVPLVEFPTELLRCEHPERNDDDSAVNWREQLRTPEVERFEAAAGDLLDELGYVRASPSQAASLSAQQVMAQRFEQEFIQPGRPPEALADYRRRSNRNNPFVFIIGCPRSGTTLLQRLLDAHPAIAISSETFWLPYFFKRRIGLTPEGIVRPEIVSRLFEYYKFYRMKIQKEELERLCAAKESIHYASLVTEIFNLYGDYRDKPLVGDKTPDYVRQISLLHELWPSAKFIHLIRDGRDVALSATSWKRKLAKLEKMFPSWAEEPVITAAFWWDWHVREGQSAAEALGSRLYYEIHYEALVANPANECERLCGFLSLPFDDNMLRFNDGKTRPEPGLDAKTAWRPITPGLRDWRSQMAALDIEVFEAAAGPLLSGLGYARSCSTSNVETIRRAETVRSRFDVITKSLGEWLP
jgi:hypothetical protein